METNFFLFDKVAEGSDICRCECGTYDKVPKLITVIRDIKEVQVLIKYSAQTTTWTFVRLPDGVSLTVHKWKTRKTSATFTQLFKLHS